MENDKPLFPSIAAVLDLSINDIDEGSRKDTTEGSGSIVVVKLVGEPKKI